jgi:YebC/PmpR family DNA-binding regulatory protein
MSGHSKWSSIKHKKAAKDVKRGKLFTKLIKEITVAARLGGGDINANPRLRTAVLTGKAASMPAENIDRAIKKGTGGLDSAAYEEVSYEGYGPGGAAMMVHVVTDNKNRTVSEIRRLFTRYGGSLGESGCVAWMFDNKGLITVNTNEIEEERLMSIALEGGAEDVREEDGHFEVMVPPEDFERLRAHLEKEKVPMVTAQTSMIPKNTVLLEAKYAEQALKLAEELEEQEDVQTVSASFDIPDEFLENAG